MTYYDEMGCWLENGEFNPEKELENAFDDFEDDYEETPTFNKQTVFEDYVALITSKYVR